MPDGGFVVEPAFVQARDRDEKLELATGESVAPESDQSPDAHWGTSAWPGNHGGMAWTNDQQETKGSRQGCQDARRKR